jgi:putative membrane protein
MEETELILRDRLAMERTKLAKERTSLAYIRTGISLALGGLFFVGYFPADTVYSYVGYATVFIAVLFTAYGFHHNSKSREVVYSIMSEVNKIEGGPPKEEKPEDEEAL